LRRIHLQLFNGLGPSPRSYNDIGIGIVHCTLYIVQWAVKRPVGVG
jgi:hypothetical protein